MITLSLTDGTSVDVQIAHIVDAIAHDLSKGKTPYVEVTVNDGSQVRRYTTYETIFSLVNRMGIVKQ